MVGNGYLPEEVARSAEAEPVRVAAVRSVKTVAPAAIHSVFDELDRIGGGYFGVEDLFLGRLAVHATVNERVLIIANEALEDSLGL